MSASVYKCVRQHRTLKERERTDDGPVPSVPCPENLEHPASDSGSLVQTFPACFRSKLGERVGELADLLFAERQLAARHRDIRVGEFRVGWGRNGERSWTRRVGREGAERAGTSEVVEGLEGLYASGPGEEWVEVGDGELKDSAWGGKKVSISAKYSNIRPSQIARE